MIGESNLVSVKKTGLGAGAKSKRRLTLALPALQASGKMEQRFVADDSLTMVCEK